MVEWMRVGFVHGVMNTDNMAISGETLDFIKAIGVNHICAVDHRHSGYEKLGYWDAEPMERSLDQLARKAGIDGWEIRWRNALETGKRFGTGQKLGPGVGLKATLLAVPPALLTPTVFFVGVISSVALDAGYVVLPPLAAALYYAAGRSPLVGLAAVFAGVSAGFSANLMLGTIDPLLAGISEEAARIIDPGYTITPACNYYFMVVSTFLIAGVGTWITEKVVIPRLGDYEGEKPSEGEKLKKLTRKEKRGVFWAFIACLALLAVALIGLLPSGGFLADRAPWGQTSTQQ